LWWILDLQKITTAILYKRLVPSSFVKMRAVLDVFFENKWLLDELKRLGCDSSTIDSIWELYNYLQKILKEDEYVKDDIDFISDWFDENIDNLRKIAYNSDEMLMDYQQELVQKSNVWNVKLKYVINQWYFIEITNKDIDLFESNLASLTLEWWDEKFDLIRRNTLKWSQRYTSKYLDQIQWKILEAKEDLINHEFKLLEEVKNSIWNIIGELTEFANYIAWFDLYTSYAIFSQENKLVKPKYLDFTDNIEIKWWRHLVIEKFLENNQQFIPNDLFMSIASSQVQNNEEDGFVHIVTWPNMWWKSTFLRQNALIVLMAHCGFYVPANEANISLVDWIFARVGSGDIIAKNQSTFMTEMVEVANILNNATENSFVIFDELGRWTSTYDWLALTKAILEYVATEIKAKTLIATHYHELIKLENQYNWIKNYSVSVYETDKDVVFMKKIVKWWADKSYGLDVAKLAGISNVILERANENLEWLQSNFVDIKKSELRWENKELFKTSRFIEKKDPRFEKIETLLRSFDVNNMTPLQALQLLEKIKGELK
jgi:DNA mismatch repair protein MutS